MHNAQTVGKLIGLGLSSNEALVYAELSSVGPSTTEPIIKATGLHRQLVYDALAKLEKRGLASFVLKGKRRVYQASSPKALVEMAKSAYQASQELANELQAISPALQEEAHIYVGSQGFRAVMFNILESSGGVLSILGADVDVFYELTQHYYARWNREREERKIMRKMLVYKQQAEVFMQRESGERFRETRMLPEELATPGTVWLYADTTAIVSYTPEPRIVLIRSQAVHASFMNYFSILWSRAKKVYPK